MNCPVCKTTDLMMSDRQGIEIDYCPQCRGVWLDRGELDKIIERSLDMSTGRREETRESTYSSQRRHEDDYHDSHHKGHYKKKKREGFLSELFDFD